MAIRIRKVPAGNGEIWTVALCAAETDAMPGDIYLDDAIHYALAAKFADDWQGQQMDIQYPEMWALMETQKLRDAQASIEVFLQEAAEFRRC